MKITRYTVVMIAGRIAKSSSAVVMRTTMDDFKQRHTLDAHSLELADEAFYALICQCPTSQARSTCIR